MKASPLMRRSLLTAGLLFVGATVWAQAPTASGTYKPEVGQPGKDVVWVPTPQAVVDRMLDLAKVTAQDYVIDLGSGDGRTVITAAKRGAKAHGIEYNPEMVTLSQRNAAAEGLSARATFAAADIFETDFSQATVLTMFLLPELNLRLRPKILDLKPGTRVLSNTFTMDDWPADEISVVQGDCLSYCTALFWIVPAKVDGLWRFGEGQLELRQRFQLVSGVVTNGGTTAPITGATLRGDQITFSIGDVVYTGRVNGAEMQGTTSAGAQWRASR
jgi:hypothetical protein